MRFQISIGSATSDIKESVQQIVDVFRPVLSNTLQNIAPVEKFSSLIVRIVASHPFATEQNMRASGKFRNGNYEVILPINYISWARSNWYKRVNLFADLLAEAVDLVPLKKISYKLRGELKYAIVQARNEINTVIPKIVFNPKPVYILKDGSKSNNRRILFDSPTDNDKIKFLIEVIEHDSLDDASYLPHNELLKLNNDEMYKFYRKIKQELYYKEAWSEASRVIEHWGKCGSEGQTKIHLCDSHDETKELLLNLKNNSQIEGYYSIPSSAHRTLVVRKKIDGIGTHKDLDCRHRLEEFLNEKAGWLGLGHCDGGSIGSGSMEAFCRVVDFDLAKASLSRELLISPFKDFKIEKA